MLIRIPYLTQGEIRYMYEGIVIKTSEITVKKYRLQTLAEL